MKALCIVLFLVFVAVYAWGGLDDALVAAGMGLVFYPIGRLFLAAIDRLERQ